MFILFVYSDFVLVLRLRVRCYFFLVGFCGFFIVIVLLFVSVVGVWSWVLVWRLDLNLGCLSCDGGFMGFCFVGVVFWWSWLFNWCLIFMCMGCCLNGSVHVY